MRKKIFLKIGLISIFCFLIFIGQEMVSYARLERPQVVIRVGFPEQDGNSFVDDSGKLSGYTYDYLQEIAQYTGWEYEFVRVPGNLNESLDLLLDMLEKGDIDIVGTMVFNEETEQLFDFSGHSYGTAYTVLNVLEENTAINETNFQANKNIRIAVYKNSKTRISELMSFCSMNNLEPILVECESDKEQLEAMKKGEADAMLSRDLVPTKGVRNIAKFAPQPFYFATTKGNSNIVNKLNVAIAKINETDPYFGTSLYEHYFGVKDRQLVFTDEEKDYLRSVGDIRVTYGFCEAPYFYNDTSENQFAGISKEILDYISKKTGLNFTYIRAENQNELKEILQTGRADIITAIPYNYDTAKEFNVALTRPYASSQVILAVNNNSGLSNLETKKLALPYGFNYMNISDKNVTYYNTVEECINAVNSGEADYAFGDGYSVQYETNRSNYKNISLIPQSDLINKVCIGIVKPVDVKLLSILNKTIANIPDNELQSIIYRSTIRMPEKITLTKFIDSNPRQAIFITAIFAVLLISVMAFNLRTKIKISSRLKLENQRYLQLCDLTNEYIFQYDFITDRLMLSEKSANYFGMPHVMEQYSKYLETNSENGKKLLNQLKSESTGIEEARFQLKDGSYRWFRISVKNIKDNNGRLISSVGKIADIQSEKNEKEILLQKSLKDGLTEIYNAATSKRMIDDCLKERQNGVLIIIDIDHFKDINDSYGHYSGDKVLVEIASILKNIFRKDDIVGRLGGDEFIVFMKNVIEQMEIKEKCQVLMEHVRAMEIMGVDAEITLSIGAAVVTEYKGFDMVYKSADSALYVVKNRGRNGIEIIWS